MKISEICQTQVVTIDPNATIVEAAKLMQQSDIGSLVVMDKAIAKASGILTDRDIVIKVIAAGKDPGQVKVSEYMSKNLYVENKNADVMELIKAMEEKGVRRVPIVDDKQKLYGMVSLDDLCLMVDKEQESIAQIIRKQISKISAIH